jgi:hypothetical protein
MEAALRYARAFGRSFAQNGKLLVAVAPSDPNGGRWSSTVQMHDVQAFEITWDETVTAWDETVTAKELP